ncbi:MAG: apolipoprotein N-acyltransferase [Fimbriimonas sp.]|nr:apolipoprotein N-acyltransferase [Fimbriimonas sp.]
MASRAKAWFLKRWPALLSALLLILAFPPFDGWPFVFVALVPLLWKLSSSDGKDAWRSGYLFGFVYFLAQMVWVYKLTVHWTHNSFLGYVPWLIAASLAGLFYGWVFVLMRHCYIRKWPWLIPVVWAGVEVCRSYIPVLAFPWALVATPLYKAPSLIQAAHFGAIYLVSAWVVLLNVILAMVCVPDLRPKIRPLLVAFLGLLTVSIIQYRIDPPADVLPVTVVQPGVDMAFGNPATVHEEAAFNIDGFMASALTDGSRLMVLPEGAIKGDDDPPKPPFRLDPGLPIVFGAQRGKGPTFQTAFGFDGHWTHADKTRLVIFGEFVPGRSTFPFIAKAFDLPTGDLDASPNGVKNLVVGGTAVGPMLCFEGLFPEVSYLQARNGSRMLAVMCIDDWYMGTPAPEQLRAAATFRAVETGLPLVRSASTGYSLALDAHGNLLGQLPLGQPAALRTELRLPKESALFPLLPVFPTCCLITVFVLPWVKRPKKPADQ